MSVVEAMAKAYIGLAWDAFTPTGKAMAIDNARLALLSLAEADLPKDYLLSTGVACAPLEVEERRIIFSAICRALANEGEPGGD